MITKNVAGDALGIATGDAARTMLTRILVLVVAMLALGLWLVAQRTVVELLFFTTTASRSSRRGRCNVSSAPAVRVGRRRRASLAGLVVAVPLAAMNITPWGINVGLLGLVANVAVLALVSGSSLISRTRFSH